MPTRHRRINVTCDAELAAALDRARDALPQTSDAGRLRALAIEGARHLATEERARRDLLARPGVRPAHTAARDLPWADELLDGPVSDEGTRALEWVRGER